MGWISLRTQTIKRDGKYVEVKYGDPIPEAASWHNISSYIRTGFIRWQPDEAPSRDNATAGSASVETHRPEEVKTEAEPQPQPRKRGRRRS